MGLTQTHFHHLIVGAELTSGAPRSMAVDSAHDECVADRPGRHNHVRKPAIAQAGGITRSARPAGNKLRL
jgi:hypothetical protein